ncbi:E3 ubiquitin-protein ligase TRIM58 [Acipenser ruthenus]|uniref:E3 ubiquitin-protein ligase TRIM58 n=1 Tax=Acipenser ruthenus TaxID=7906 RepID=A0A444UCP3_ACIRT|nr:E3 ubiquitin-protein ligase TRIM58 [Acipenser ruthenus]
MATAASPEEKFSCSVCLDLFTEPATIPCGHSFCLDCIGSYWDQNDQTGVYSCPQCRENFTPRQYHDRTGGGIEENESSRPVCTVYTVLNLYRGAGAQAVTYR